MSRQVIDDPNGVVWFQWRVDGQATTLTGILGSPAGDRQVDTWPEAVPPPGHELGQRQFLAAPR